MSLRRPSTPVFAGFAALGLLALAEITHAQLAQAPHAARLAGMAAQARSIGLTDAALFTEARYTRHPGLADLNTALQDNPVGFDHFPSAAFVPRPDMALATRIGAPGP